MTCVLLNLACGAGLLAGGVVGLQHVQHMYAGRVTGKLASVQASFSSGCIFTYSFEVSGAMYTGIYTGKCLQGTVAAQLVPVLVRYNERNPADNYAPLHSTVIKQQWPIALLSVGAVMILGAMVGVLAFAMSYYCCFGRRSASQVQPDHQSV